MRDRKRVGVLRVLGSLLLAAAISIALLYAADAALKHFMQQTAMTRDYYVLTGISTIILFLLLVLPANRPLRGLKVFVRWLAIIVVAVLLWGAGTAWMLQPKMMYLADHYEPQSEETVKALPNTEAISITGKDGKVYQGWMWKNMGEQPAGLIIYFGGNAQFAAEFIGGVASNSQVPMVYQGFNLMMIDNPGYGLSQGTPSEESIMEMARATWDYALTRPDVRADKMVLAGWSLGTGTAIRLAAEKQPAGLILSAPFYNGAELVNAFVGQNIMEGYTRPLVRNKYLNDEYAPLFTHKALIIAAQNDHTIPPEQAHRLSDLFREKTLVTISGGHSDTVYSVEAQTAIGLYLREVLAK